MVAVSRKKLLKEPDEFITFSARALAWSRQNSKLVVGGAVVLLVLLAAALGFRAWRISQAGQAAAALAPLTEKYLEVVAGVGEKHDLAALEAGFSQVAQEYSSTLDAQRAVLSLGDLYYRQAKYEQAAKTFQKIVQEMDPPAQIAPLAWHGWGQCLEAEKDYLGAAESYARAIALAGPNLGQLYSLDRARVLAAAGQKAQAVELYRQVLASSPDAPSAKQARFQLAQLGEAAPPAQPPAQPATAN